MLFDSVVEYVVTSPIGIQRMQARFNQVAVLVYSSNAVYNDRLVVYLQYALPKLDLFDTIFQELFQ